MVRKPINGNGWLSNEALIDLRNQIVLNSLYYSDYKNDYLLDEREVSLFFDSFLSYVSELMEEDGIADESFFENLKDYDTAENLIAWYACYENNPFNLSSLMEALSQEEAA